VRGIANAELTPELAFRLGEAAGHLLIERGSCDSHDPHGSRGRIVVGRDTRLSGAMLEAALVAGITSCGVDALLVGIIPTPAVAFLVRDLEADGGVVISASHNPPEYNGIKLFDRSGFKLSNDFEFEIERFCLADHRIGAPHRVKRPTGDRVGASHHIADAHERYIAHAVRTAECSLEGMRIALDCGHGASASTSADALRRLGAEVETINCDWNGTDINVDCGSTHLGAISSLVAEGGFDLGIAHDGDADRVLAVDEFGNAVDGDQILAVCAERMNVAERLANSTVVATVMSNLGFEAAMGNIGVSVERAKVGDRYVLEQMRTTGAVLGGEQSGHIIFLGHNSTGDGLVTAIQLACAVKFASRPLSEAVKIMTPYPQVLVNVPVADTTALAASRAISDAVASVERLLGERGRVLVRASGTESLVRVMVEAAEEQIAADACNCIAEVVFAELGGTR